MNTTKGTISGFSTISTNTTDSIDTGAVSVSTSAEALAIISELASSVAQSGDDVTALLSAHEADLTPHDIVVSDAHTQLLTNTLSAFFIINDVTIIDPTMTIENTRRTRCYNGKMINTTIPVQYINERTYVQMNKSYAMEIITPWTTLGTTIIDDIAMPSFQESSFVVPTRIGNNTLAFYVDIPDVADITVLFNDITVISTKHGSRLSATDNAHILHVSGSIYGIYIFDTSETTATATITVLLTDESVPVITGLRSYESHAIMDGIMPISSDNQVTVSLPSATLSDAGYSVGISYMTGRSFSGLWMTMGSLFSIEEIDGEKLITMTDGDVTVTRSFAFTKTDHDMSIVTFYPRRIEWADNNGHALSLECNSDITMPGFINVMPNDGYIGGIICAPYSQLETITSYLNKKG